MISLRDVSKTYKLVNGRKVVLDKVAYDFAPGVNVGILGRNGAGKSTLINIISGTETPDSGEIHKTARVSWPLGYSMGFNSKLTGRENVRFVCRVYGEDYKKVMAFVEDFSELGEYLEMPILTYSSGMKSKLVFGLTMAFQFDYYLIDEGFSAGDAVFQKKSQACFEERRKQTTLLVVSHSSKTIRRFCDKALVLFQGKLLDFPGIDQAEDFYLKECCGLPGQKNALGKSHA
ncbi:capsule polysaccharide export ATP-binding protein CtrD [Betaproteobacteria bacterium]|nr:capsule polysaccharide export ATP-binding protein CtrD [Betaproteobacteria bacterium]